MGFVFNRSGGLRERRSSWGITSPSDLVPLRTSGRGGLPYITNDSALKQSGVWAAIRLRADLISTMDVTSHRIARFPDGTKYKLETDLTPFFANPGFMEWRYSSQIELDRSGNSVGIITAKDANNFPSEIELQPSSAVTLRMEKGELRYIIGNETYEPEDIWHEKQYTVSGLAVGLSPVAYAALTLGQYRTIQEFVSDWFISGTLPRAQLKNAAKKLNRREIATAKEMWRVSRMADEPFVTGNDWEYSLIQAQQSASEWVDALKLSLEDEARFFGVPADLIDASAGGPNITYANVTQRNLQFLIMHLGPAIKRRENAWSTLLPRQRYVELDRSNLLEMDPMTFAQWIKTRIEARTICPSEAREYENRPPFTMAQIREFDELGLNRRGSTPFTSLSPVPVVGAVDVGTNAPAPGDEFKSYPTDYNTDPDVGGVALNPAADGTDNPPQGNPQS